MNILNLEAFDTRSVAVDELDGQYCVSVQSNQSPHLRGKFSQLGLAPFQSKNPDSRENKSTPALWGALREDNQIWLEL